MARPHKSRHKSGSKKGIIMKIKPATKKGGVLVELGPDEIQIPAKSEAEPPMFKLQKILVPVDFSDCSSKALQYAVPFARQFGAAVLLLHVIEPYPSVPEMAPYDFETVQDGRETLEKFRKSIDEPVDVKTFLRTGIAHTEIVNAAKELEIDLIVISTHGRSGLNRMMFGSTAERVIRHAFCPVLVVREREHEFLSDARSCSMSNKLQES
jgi:universal stress protein A